MAARAWATILLRRTALAFGLSSLQAGLQSVGKKWAGPDDAVRARLRL